MSISPKDRKVLWTRACNICAFPGCRQELTIDDADASTGAELVTVVAQEAHIRSARPKGPRHDPAYPKDKLDTYDNLILLCPTHHTMIDANNGAGYKVDALIKMRSDHEKQQARRDRIGNTIRAYLADQYTFDNKVLFEQVDLHGPSVDSMFVDVPFGCRPDARVAELMGRIATEHPGDLEAAEGADDQIVTGAAQALLHPDWSGSALLVGGPGQGKSTLLQYVCQFHRARRLGHDTYDGKKQQLAEVTKVPRVPIRLDLRNYAMWASRQTRDLKPAKSDRPRKGDDKGRNDAQQWPSIEEYIASEIKRRSGGLSFEVDDLATLVSTEAVLIALDGLDEVANLKHREMVSDEIVATQVRLEQASPDLVVLVGTRPGATTSALWSSSAFPRLNLRRLSQGLRLQYLQQWAVVARLTPEATDRLQQTFMDNQHVPHIRELAAYPMQLAILLHLLYRRQLLPQQRTELYSEYLKTFLDREQREDKEPLLAQERQIIEDIHAFLAWHLQTSAEEGQTAGAIKREHLKALLREHLAGRADGQKLTEKLFSAFTTRVLCLVERDTGMFQFEVQSLREYFAALYIFENATIKGHRNSRDDCLNALLVRPYWSNVCRFFVGMFSKGEVRGIRHNLRQLSKDRDLGLHPMLRSTAALFLNDRTYEGQNDDPIREVVDFILEGPGVVLAEDGLLDVSGSALFLSERAGRSQVVEHVKERLEDEQSPVMRATLAACLRRHAVSYDNLADWWWKHQQSNWAWLQTAGQLGLLSDLSPRRESDLAALLRVVTSDTVWATEILQQGGYNGTADDVLIVVRNEINDGAGDALLGWDPTTPVGQLVEGAAVAQLLPSLATAVDRTTGSSAALTQVRRKFSDSLLAEVVSATNKLREHPGMSASDQEWQDRLIQVAEVWGDGWVLRQAVATISLGVDLATIADMVRSRHPELASALKVEAEMRDNRGNVDWWHQRLAMAREELESRHWVFSLLTRGHQAVLIGLAGQLNELVDSLAPRHYRAMREGLKAYSRFSAARKLTLQGPLRLNQIQLSPKLLWLVRVVATEGSVEQIDKRLVKEFTPLLHPGMGDLRELVGIAGKGKTIRFDVLRNCRSVLPVGGWASNIKLGSMRVKLPDEVLRAPAAWPGDLVQRAVEEVEGRMTAYRQPIASVASADEWFQETN
ncbi:HNH endonuclease [Microtetraspora sp. AC03309]|uniref:hypothetical protein n=1 Tax=Microtetraspora sp. AC03309 TaxID=2779376 RepID=UPI001E5FE715|nr:hypothetical protein [Microtetraspora sp. AC03309]MCC5578219.1 HNH endonuclease [Microtetraspora sp. AC03309]